MIPRGTDGCRRTSPSAALSILVVLALATAPGPALGQAHGTAFALYRSPDLLVVAADSKLTWLDSTTTETTSCKIRRVGRIWFVMGGVLRLPHLKYDAAEIAVGALRRSAGVLEGAATFERDILPRLKELVRHIDGGKKQADPEWQEVYHFPLTVYFFGFERGRAVAAARQFERRPEVEGGVAVSRQDYPGDLAANVMLASPVALAEPYFSQNSGWRSTRPADAVQKFVEHASRQRPATTGGPVDVLSIDSAGYRWLRKKTNCPD